MYGGDILRIEDMLKKFVKISDNRKGCVIINIEWGGSMDGKEKIVLPEKLQIAML